MLTRRSALKGASSFAIVTAAGGAQLCTAAKSTASAQSPQAWPKPIGSPVLESLRPVIEQSRDVRTHYDKILEVARWMAYEDLPMPKIAVPYDLDKTPEVAIDFIMVANAIDSAFTDFKTHVKFQTDYLGEHLSDADAMMACLKRAMDDGIPILDGRFLARVRRSELQMVFAGNIEMPMLDEKMDVFHRVGEVLAARYDGRFRNFVRSCSPRLYDGGKGLIDRLVAEFPRYRDVSEYDGHEVKFYKLAQLGCWGMYSGLGSSGPSNLRMPIR